MSSAQPGPEHAAGETRHVLEPSTFDLWSSRLIEASAGTGKTWTIAALYVRLVLGHGGAHAFPRALRPAEILVMTFTRAATRELSDRIRERLLTAARCFRGEQMPEPSDSFLPSLLAAYPDQVGRRHAAWLLATAAENMDAAAVHTIDAWCQRMLREHAFDSGCLFDEELVADEEAILLQAAQDYWRQSCYPMSPASLRQVLTIWNGVDALVKDVRELARREIAASAGEGTLEQVLQQACRERSQALQQLKSGWAERAAAMLEWLDTQTSSGNSEWDGRRLSARHYRGWLGTLRQWAENPDDDAAPALNTGWTRLTPGGLMETRKAGAGPVALPQLFAEFAALAAAVDRLPGIAPGARRHAAVRVAQRMLELKRQSGSFGFSDMLWRLHAALNSANGERLRQSIVSRYPVILVDEFQDTSPVQYRIFERIYQTEKNDHSRALVLIGDPKQSIYGFRGADIYSYMQARRATLERHYALDTNFRATAQLMGAINHFFGQAEARHGEGAFLFRGADDNPLPYFPVRARGRNEILVTSHGSLAAITVVHELQPRSAEDNQRHFAALCAEQIAQWLNDPLAGLRPLPQMGQDATAHKRLRPADIAVLVRTGREAAAVRRELARRSIASVYLSDRDSVFASPVALDLVHWLRGVAGAPDARLVRAALATATAGLPLSELELLASNDDAFESRLEQMRQLHSVWTQQGVLAMLRQTLHRFQLPASWLSSAEGERRLTNYLHLAELLQSAGSKLEGEQALIRWLENEIQAGSSGAEDQVVRLESDAELVKLVTIYKSKGLEYPLVCLPFATSMRARDRKSTPFVELVDSAGGHELLLEYDDAALALADRERLREDLRLLYVAVTRARHALWLGFGALKIGNNDACVTHRSAAGYLIGGTGPRQAAQWLDALQQLAAPCPDIVLQAAAPGTGCTVLQADESNTALRQPAPYQADFDRDWQVGSFSRLAKDVAALPMGSDLSALLAPRGADDELPVPDGRVTVGEASEAPAWHRFSRGAEAGNFLHDQLEWLATEGFALAGNAALAERLRRRCERAGRGKYAGEIVSWLTRVTQTALPGPQVALSGLNRILPEMEFWLPAQKLDAREIDLHCQRHLLAGVQRPALPQRQLHGMLMGFSDLVFEHQGKFWVLDYKSNWLGDSDRNYSAAALARSMAEHRYDVQAALYMLALHRLLGQRLGANYRCEDHLGGAVYLFLRGIAGPQSGVCLIGAAPPLLQALDAMLLPAQATT
jgi:exodeoxyribonuclease V beta subunit